MTIWVDGVERLTVHRRALDALGIEPGATVDVEELLQSAAAAERRAGVEAAFALLAIRDRTARELSGRLRQKGFAQEAVAAVLERVAELGYLDDRQYAVDFARARMAHRPAGRRALGVQLRRKGVAAETIDEVLDECFQGVDETALAAEVIQRRLPRLAKLDARTARSRLVALLQRRGFDYEVIHETVARAMPEIDMDEDVASPEQ